ncbi:MAG: LysE family translocator [Pseudomonadota bacterium]
MTEQILSLASLFVLSLATSIIPGPSNFLTMRTAMRHGRGPAVATAIGTALGCLIWCVAALVGLGALLAAAPWLYKTMRIAGGLYLIWFAIGLWRAKAEPAADEPPPGAARAAFWQGLAICLTNPKSVLFFASVFSAYVGPDTPDWVHYAAVALVTVTCLVWQAGLALALSAARAAQAYARAQKPLDRGAAGLMGLFGLSLLWTSA